MAKFTYSLTETDGTKRRSWADPMSFITTGVYLGIPLVRIQAKAISGKGDALLFGFDALGVGGGEDARLVEDFLALYMKEEHVVGKLLAIADVDPKFKETREADLTLVLDFEDGDGDIEKAYFALVKPAATASKKGKEVYRVTASALTGNYYFSRGEKTGNKLPNGKDEYTKDQTTALYGSELARAIAEGENYKPRVRAGTAGAAAAASSDDGSDDDEKEESESDDEEENEGEEEEAEEDEAPPAPPAPAPRPRGRPPAQAPAAAPAAAPKPAATTVPAAPAGGAPRPAPRPPPRGTR